MGWLRDIKEGFTGEGAARAATAGQEAAIESQEKMQKDQLQFLSGQRVRSLQDIKDITQDWGAAQRLAGSNQRGYLTKYGSDLEAGMERTATGQRAALDLGLQSGLGAIGQERGRQQDLLGGYDTRGQAAMSEMGQLAGSDLNVDVTQDPGYQFRMRQGEQALQRQQSAGGRSMSGAALKEMGRYSQGLASQEYGAAYNRASSLRGERLSMLGQLGQMGYGAASQQAQGSMALTGAETGMYGQHATQSAQAMPQYAAAAQNLAGTVQDPGQMYSAQLAATTGTQSQYTGAVSQSMANLGQSQGQYWQNIGQIGAAEAQAPWNNLMGMGQIAAATYGGTGWGA